VDKGLASLLGAQIQISFNLTGWRHIKNVAKDTQIYMTHAGRPILVSFAHGKGQVIYTCFHNHAQVSEREAALLRYLVLKPLMAQASAELVDATWGAPKQELQETVGTVAPGAASPWYEYDFPGGPLMARLNWKGAADLQLEVQGAGGHWHDGGDAPPVTITVPAASPGRWRYRVIGRNTPLANFPFVVLIGPSEQVSLAGPTGLPSSVWAPLASIPLPVEPELLDAIKILDVDSSSKDDSSIPIRILDE
jgi:hypothetical protein